jgi:hypothetical protein
VKYCFIQKVPFRVPGSERILWANVLAQSQGLTLLIVPKSHTKEPHSIYFATENVEEHVFVAVTEHRFDIETLDVIEVAKKLKVLGQSFFDAECRKIFWRDIGDED